MIKRRHIVIGTPVKEEPLDKYQEAVTVFCEACGAEPDRWKVDWLKVKSGLVKARDSICAFAVHVQADDVIMWDSDTTPAKNNDLFRLLSHDVDIVGVPYTTKEHPARWVYSPLPGNPSPDENGLMEVLECGTGLKRYRVSMLRDLYDAYPEQEYDAAERTLPPDARRFHLHVMGVFNRRWLSEDYGFDYMARKAGMRVFVDTKLYARHWGMAPYPLMAPPMPGVIAKA